VYKALNKETNQHVAIKIVRKFELSKVQVKKSNQYHGLILYNHIVLYREQVF
jgi:hypothetical protein